MQFKKGLILVALAGTGGVGGILYHTNRQVESEFRTSAVYPLKREAGEKARQSADAIQIQRQSATSSGMSLQNASDQSLRMQEQPSSEDIASSKPTLSQDHASLSHTSSLSFRTASANAIPLSPTSVSMDAARGSATAESVVISGSLGVPYQQQASAFSAAQPASPVPSSQSPSYPSAGTIQPAEPSSLQQGQPSGASGAYNSIPNNAPNGSSGTPYNGSASAGVMYRSDSDPVLLNHEQAVLLKGQDAVNFNTPAQDLQVLQSANGSQVLTTYPSPVKTTP